jgi:hypothetical protein
LVGKSPNTAAGYANPFAKAVYNTANKTAEGSHGPYRVDSYREAAKNNTERLVPNIDYLRDMIHPPKDPGMYTEDASRWGRTKRELGVLPIKVDREEAAAAKKRIEGGKPEHVKNHEARMAALRGALRKHGRTSDMEAVKASRSIRAIDLAVRRGRKEKGDKLTSEEKARLAFATYKKAIPEHASAWASRLERGGDEDKWQSYYEKMREQIAKKYTRYGLNMDGTESKR